MLFRSEKLNILYAMTMNFMTLYLAISLGSELARMYEELDAVIVSIVTVACYIITVAPVNLADNVLDVTGFSAKGMFTLFVVAIIVVEFMHFAYKHNIIIILPKSVHHGIAQRFASLLPMALLLLFF